MSDTSKKIIEIETKIAFQEETIEQLNEIIIEQQKAIDKLQLQLLQINSKIKEQDQWSHENSIIDEKPPHY